jgi:hypothetical protein
MACARNGLLSRVPPTVHLSSWCKRAIYRAILAGMVLARSVWLLGMSEADQWHSRRKLDEYMQNRRTESCIAGKPGLRVCDGILRAELNGWRV